MFRNVLTVVDEQISEPWLRMTCSWGLQCSCWHSPVPLVETQSWTVFHRFVAVAFRVFSSSLGPLKQLQKCKHDIFISIDRRSPIQTANKFTLTDTWLWLTSLVLWSIFSSHCHFGIDLFLQEFALLRQHFFCGSQFLNRFLSSWRLLFVSSTEDFPHFEMMITTLS